MFQNPFLPITIMFFIFQVISSMPKDDYEYSNDGGIYDYSDYSDDGRSEEKEHEYSLTNIVIHSSKVRVIVEEDNLIRLPCLMDNPDDIPIIWSHITSDGTSQIAVGEVILNNKGRQTVKVDKTGSVLLIPQAKESDSGEYVCEVATGTGSLPKLVHTVNVNRRSETVEGGEQSPLKGASKSLTNSLFILVIALIGCFFLW